MNRRSLHHFVAGTALAALSIGLTIASAEAQSPAPSPSASPAAASSAAPAVTTAIVDTKHFAFTPATLTVSRGTKVTFKNSDTTAHTVTATDGSFDSGDMSEGALWSHTFKKPGTYNYTCTYHTYMQGTIIVK